MLGLCSVVQSDIHVRIHSYRDTQHFCPCAYQFTASKSNLTLLLCFTISHSAMVSSVPHYLSYPFGVTEAIIFSELHSQVCPQIFSLEDFYEFSSNKT